MPHSLTLCVESQFGTFSCGQIEVKHLGQAEAMAVGLESVLEPAWPKDLSEQDWYTLYSNDPEDWYEP